MLSARTFLKMSSPKKQPSKKSPHDKSSDELMREINKLNSLLQDKLKMKRDTEEEEHQLPLKKMIGRRIRIALEKDPSCGQEATVTSPRSNSKKPVFWWFKLSSTGEQKCKAWMSFKLLPRDTSPPSETRQPVINLSKPNSSVKGVKSHCVGGSHGMCLGMCLPELHGTRSSVVGSTPSVILFGLMSRLMLRCLILH